ncbi:NUDIX domain-containing protein [Cereibacter changlensis]|uniref:NUDIX domain-containing protein n=1 Tax=Cereibacter changlensis TaxID=402884 RepID=A0A4V5NL28_9RHOB|nr:NUDIX domain-containing protein [Cereibacter changlensis]TKA94067.1 NUDIX domain-containing protein [Cereibacter changlensis]
MQEIPIRCHAVSLVAVRVVNGKNEVLLLRRTRSLQGEWCQIAGAVETGETAWQAAIRELAEETGLVPITLYSGDVCEQFYEPHLDAISILPVFIATIDPTSSVQLNPEHSDYCWVSFSDADRMVPFAGQRKVLRHVEAEFMLRVPSHHLEIKVA